MSNKSTINQVIRALIISDFFLFFGLGLLSPIFAVFILEHIEDTLKVIGLSTTIYWLTRVLLVIPLSKFMDKRGGHNDEYLLMIAGTFIISLVPLFYIISTEPWHIYVLQFVNGLGHSMAVPAWRILFTNHIDKQIVGFEWSLEDVGIGLATGISAISGALIADKLGFDALFLLIFLFGSISSLILLHLYQNKAVIFSGIIRRHDRAPLKLDTIK